MYERDTSDPERRTFVPGMKIVVNSTELRMPGTAEAPQPLRMARLSLPAQLAPVPLRRSARGAARAAATAHQRLLDAQAQQQAPARARWVIPAAAENDILRNCW